MERDGRELHPALVAEHRLIGEIQHGLRVERVDRFAERARRIHLAPHDRRAAEVEAGSGRELLRAADEDRRQDLVPGGPGGGERPCRHGGVVLAVDQGKDPDRLHGGYSVSAPSTAFPPSVISDSV